MAEDSKATRNFVKKILSSMGIDVEEAGSGFEALKLIRALLFDLVVTDINMPDLSGLDLIKFVRSDPKNSDAVIIVVSIEGTEKDIKKAIELGANEYIVKPLRKETIEKTLGKYL